MKKLPWLTCLALTFCNNGDAPAPVNNNIGTPIAVDAVKQVLAKGINLTNWFNDYSDYAQFDTRFSASDMLRIKAEGFTYIRLPIGTPVLFIESNPSQLNQTNLKKIDAAVQNAVNAGLAVVLDAVHNSNDGLEIKLATVSGYADKVATYWGSLATYFSKYETDKIFFEVYNEPHVASSGAVAIAKTWWWPMQQRFVKAIRLATANHYIIAGAEGWNNRFQLLANAPYPEANVIYNFHCYNPFLFTHQGATWTGWAPAMEARGIPFPSSPAAVDSLIKATSFQDLKDQLAWYGSQRYNADSLLRWIKPLADWGMKNNVLVTCNEFGSYKPYAPRPSHLRWVHDMRSALEANGVPWAMWDYDEGFGLIDYTNNDRSKPVVDAEVLVALGLK
jgi:hypothetical protein